MNLPFGLKQKPLNYYFENGLIRFAVRESKLFYLIKSISKHGNFTLQIGGVKSKEHLDKLLSIKHLNEIPTIEEVRN